MTEQPFSDASEPVPVEWDFDAWIDGAALAQRSVTVYGRPDLIALMEDADRRRTILAKAADDPEVTLAEQGDLEAVNAELARLLQEYEASKSTWYVQALTADALRTLDDTCPVPDLPAKPTPEQTRAFTDAMDERGLHLLAAAVVKVVSPNSGVTEGVTVEQLRRLRGRIGNPQIAKLVQASTRATRDEPEVPVPFSPPGSPPART